MHLHTSLILTFLFSTRIECIVLMLKVIHFNFHVLIIYITAPWKSLHFPKINIPVFQCLLAGFSFQTVFIFVFRQGRALFMNLFHFVSILLKGIMMPCWLINCHNLLQVDNQSEIISKNPFHFKLCSFASYKICLFSPFEILRIYG